MSSGETNLIGQLGIVPCLHSWNKQHEIDSNSSNIAGCDKAITKGILCCSLDVLLVLHSHAAFGHVRSTSKACSICSVHMKAHSHSFSAQAVTKGILCCILDVVIVMQLLDMYTIQVMQHLFNTHESTQPQCFSTGLCATSSSAWVKAAGNGQYRHVHHQQELACCKPLNYMLYSAIELCPAGHWCTSY